MEPEIKPNDTVNPSQFSGNTVFDRVGIAAQSFPQGTLYLVGMPIGNAADITLRALWILDIADVIACEDTRESRKVLDRYGITTHLIAVHEHNEASAAEKLVERLRAGERVALITDAGSPAVSDPGARVVARVREAGCPVSPIPGPSAVIAGMSAAGLNSYTFTFVGFVPPNQKARRQMLAEYAARADAFVLYEAPHRIQELLADLAAALSPERRVVVAREMTKRFESFDAMRAGDLSAWAANMTPRGEYAIFVDSEERAEGGELPEDVRKWADAIAQSLPLSQSAALVSRVSGVKRDLVYSYLLGKKEHSEAGGGAAPVVH